MKEIDRLLEMRHCIATQKDYDHDLASMWQVETSGFRPKVVSKNVHHNMTSTAICVYAEWASYAIPQGVALTLNRPVISKD